VTGDAQERLRRDYAPAFLHYLSEGSEPGRRAAYELGRRAISEHLSILDLARIHHSVLLDALKTHRTPHELEQLQQPVADEHDGTPDQREQPLLPTPESRKDSAEQNVHPPCSDRRRSGHRLQATVTAREHFFRRERRRTGRHRRVKPSRPRLPGPPGH
jgi:Phosphoserine phosphatase RsbU, N-terminal domain